MPQLPGTYTVDGWIENIGKMRRNLLNSDNFQSYNEHGCMRILFDSVLSIESQRDLPAIKIPKFDGSPLQWPKFIEHFYEQVHSKLGLTDNRRMDLLMSQLEGDDKHFIVGIGSSGRYYAEVLIELKRQFGHKQKVARAYIEKVTTGPVLESHNASALSQFYITIRDCINTLTDLGYHSDINGTDVLMRAAKRLPKDRVNHWKRRVAKISGKKEPTLHDLKEWSDECVTIESNQYTVAT
jgi:hypothetical protein